MDRVRHSLAARYAFAMVLALLAVAVRIALTPLWGLQLPLITFYPAIMASAWLGGFGPGLTTTLLSALGANYFFMEPRFTFRLSGTAQIVAVGMFVGSGLLISLLTEALHQTRRRQAAALAREQQAERHLAAQYAVTRVLAETSSLREATPRLLQAVCESAGWDVGALWTLDEADHVVRCLDVWHVPGIDVAAFEAATRRTAFPPGVGLPGRVWANGAPAWIVDVVTDPNFPRSPDAARVGVHGAFAFPIRLGNQTLGVIEFFSLTWQQPDDDLLARMTAVGSQVGQFIERQRSEETLRDSEERLKGIIASAMDAVITIDEDERITLFNAAAEQMFRCSSGEVLGASLERFIPVAAREVHHRHIRQFGETGVTTRAMGGQQRLLAALRADGEEFPMEATISQTRVAGQKLYTVIIRDVTERVRTDQERNRSLAREQAARTEAEAANRAKDEFLTILSHELRTPLNAVYGWARMLRAGQLRDAEAERALDAIVRNANAQVQLIDDLLDVSRVITGKMRLDVRPVDLRAVVAGALDAVRPAAEAKEIRLQSVLDPRAGPITGDPDRLQQVVWNLLANAVKFTPKGGRVQVHVQRVNSHVEIVVSDTGQGIAPEILPFVFDRFRQADSSSTRAHSGLGLGLALVKHLVELHGGAVVAQSSGEGKGATFIVTLPLAIAEIPAGPVPRVHPTAVSVESLPGGVRLDGLRVLVVDDDPDALELATVILTGAGAIVRTSRSAPEALDVLRQWRPDVLVSDIEMPGEDGYSLIRKVRALDADHGGKTPAVALTAYGRVQDRMLSLTAGYSMHVPKPVDPAEFTTIIASVAAGPR